ncbi:MAG: metal-dependent hydrolase [Verrucomicrobiota bacterium]|nr:metal-dependent hydrolase [Verrucomicrobiota bacterium]
MDNLSHGLVGLAVGSVVFRKHLGTPAIWLSLVAAEVPDLDILLHSDSDPLFFIKYHRHFTHSLVVGIVISLLVALPWILKSKEDKSKWKVWWLCSFTAFASHCLLDAVTSYGTLLLWPFTSHRFAWDFISIVDPIFTGVLLIGGIAALFLRNKKVFHGSIILAGLYFLLCVIQQVRVNSNLQQIASLRGHTPERHRVLTTLGNNVVYHCIYEHQNRIFLVGIRQPWIGRATFNEGADVLKMSSQQVSDEGTRTFLWFTSDWGALDPVQSNTILDARYIMNYKPLIYLWGYDRTAGTFVPRNHIDRKQTLKWLMLRLKGQDPVYKPI